MNRLDKILGRLPGLISSHPHVIGLIGLGVYLVILPLFGAHVSNFAELLGGNYTNVTSAIGAAIAAGGTVHLAGKARASHQITEAAWKILADLYHYQTGRSHPAAPATPEDDAPAFPSGPSPPRTEPPRTGSPPNPGACL